MLGLETFGDYLCGSICSDQRIIFGRLWSFPLSHRAHIHTHVRTLRQRKNIKRRRRATFFPLLFQADARYGFLRSTLFICDLFTALCWTTFANFAIYDSITAGATPYIFFRPEKYKNIYDLPSKTPRACLRSCDTLWKLNSQHVVLHFAQTIDPLGAHSRSAPLSARAWIKTLHAHAHIAAATISYLCTIESLHTRAFVCRLRAILHAMSTICSGPLSHFQSTMGK